MVGRGGFGGGASAEDAPYELPDELRSEIATLFEDDRRLLMDVAGREVVRWAPPREAPRAEPRLRRTPGFAEEPAGWLGAELGLTQPADETPG
jgi:hypothetical protein